MRAMRAAVLAGALGLAPWAPAAGADGELDTERFRPPDGRIGLAGAGVVASRGAAGPDGVAVAVLEMSDERLAWYRVPDEGKTMLCTHPFDGATDVEVSDAVIDGAGRLVIVGTATFPTFGAEIFVLRYLYPGCAYDTSFDLDGEVFFDLAADLRGLRVRTQTVYVAGVPFERLLVAGDREVPGGGGDELDTIVVRFQDDGTLDGGFDGDGWAILDFEDETQALADFVVDGEERIVLGSNIEPFGPDPDFLVARLLPNGALDTTYGGDGWIRMSFNPVASDLLGAMEVAANGDLFFMGTFDTGVVRRISVVRWSGSSFGQVNLFAEGDLFAVTSSVLQGDRKVILSGWSNGFDGDFDVFAVRVDVPPTGSPSPDPTFGDGGEADPLTYFSFEASPGGTDAAWGIDLAGGRPVLFGEANFGDLQGLFVARLQNSYIFADGFESGDVAAWD